MNKIHIKSDEMKRQSEEQKELGNKHFKGGDIDEAINCYSNAIKLFQLNPIYYCNRSMAYLKKGLAFEAEIDCNLALNIDKNCIKALYRRGMARKQLQRYSSALNDFNQVLSLDPNNTEAKRELKSIQTLFDLKTIIDLKPIDKQIEFQSKKSLIKIPIIDKNIKINEIVVKLPEKVPKTYYQFECDWRQLIGDNCKQLRLKYLEMIGCQQIHTLFNSTLEPQMMSDLLEAISESNDVNLIYCLLDQMSKTLRFDTIVLFMSKSDENNFKSIIEKLKRNKFNEKLISEIQRKYL